MCRDDVKVPWLRGFTDDALRETRSGLRTLSVFAGNSSRTVFI